MFFEEKIVPFIAGAILCNLVGVFSSLLSGIFQGNYFGPGSWYAGLNKPQVWPPNFLFGPVWFSLYTVMGVGAAMIFMSYGFSLPLYLFIGQLCFNFLWSIIFFGLHRISFAMITLVVIDLLYVAMLGYIFFVPGENQLAPEAIKAASQAGCLFVLFIPIFLVSVFQNLFSNIGLKKEGILNVIFSWASVLIMLVLMAFLFFWLDLPTKYSTLKSNHAIFIMLFPTMLWISFASYLNFNILSLNRNS